MNMTDLRFEDRGSWTKACFAGEITYEMTQKMKADAEAVFKTLPDNPLLVCDMQEVDFLDSSGIGLLVFLNNKMRQKNGQCFLLHPSEPVRKTLELVKLMTFFEVMDDEAEVMLHTPL
jgi:anti-sigma B factor antagonist